jgi:hypothetical protein
MKSAEVEAIDLSSFLDKSLEQLRDELLDDIERLFLGIDTQRCGGCWGPIPFARVYLHWCEACQRYTKPTRVADRVKRFQEEGL